MQTSGFLALLAIATSVAHGREPPSACMLSPLATLTAGKSFSATIDNPQGRPCAATLVFSDPDFLPVTFDLKPNLCLGYQRAELSIPKEVPNGEVTVLWECAGDSGQSCSRAVIEGGTADVIALERQQCGTIECVVPVATIATLVTYVQDSTTIASSVLTTLFSTNTPILSRTQTTGSASRTKSAGSSSTKISTSTTLVRISTPVIVYVTQTPQAQDYETSESALGVASDGGSVTPGTEHTACTCGNMPTSG